MYIFFLLKKKKLFHLSWLWLTSHTAASEEGHTVPLCCLLFLQWKIYFREAIVKSRHNILCIASVITLLALAPLTYGCQQCGGEFFKRYVHRQKKVQREYDGNYQGRKMFIRTFSDEEKMCTARFIYQIIENQVELKNKGKTPTRGKISVFAFFFHIAPVFSCHSCRRCLLLIFPSNTFLNLFNVSHFACESYSLNLFSFFFRRCLVFSFPACLSATSHILSWCRIFFTKKYLSLSLFKEKYVCMSTCVFSRVFHLIFFKACVLACKKTDKQAHTHTIFISTLHNIL